jgi:hypothetical protein
MPQVKELEDGYTLLSGLDKGEQTAQSISFP